MSRDKVQNEAGGNLVARGTKKAENKKNVDSGNRAAGSIGKRPRMGVHSIYYIFVRFCFSCTVFVVCRVFITTESIPATMSDCPSKFLAPVELLLV